MVCTTPVESPEASVICVAPLVSGTAAGCPLSTLTMNAGNSPAMLMPLLIVVSTFSRTLVTPVTLNLK